MNLPLQIDVHLIHGKKVTRTKPHRMIKAWAFIVDNPHRTEPEIAIITAKHPQGIIPGVSMGGSPILRESDFDLTLV